MEGAPRRAGALYLSSLLNSAATEGVASLDAAVVVGAHRPQRAAREAGRGEAAAVQAARHGRGVRQPRGPERLRRLDAGGLAVVEADRRLLEHGGAVGARAREEPRELGGGGAVRAGHDVQRPVRGGDVGAVDPELDDRVEGVEVQRALRVGRAHVRHLALDEAHGVLRQLGGGRHAQHLVEALVAHEVRRVAGGRGVAREVEAQVAVAHPRLAQRRRLGRRALRRAPRVVHPLGEQHTQQVEALRVERVREEAHRREQRLEQRRARERVHRRRAHCGHRRRRVGGRQVRAHERAEAGGGGGRRRDGGGGGVGSGGGGGGGDGRQGEQHVEAAEGRGRRAGEHAAARVVAVEGDAAELAIEQADARAALAGGAVEPRGVAVHGHHVEGVVPPRPAAALRHAERAREGAGHLAQREQRQLGRGGGRPHDDRVLARP
eukprot:scaffold44945_cov61-Phaeocystis_antarctica.AAC.3